MQKKLDILFITTPDLQSEDPAEFEIQTTLPEHLVLRIKKYIIEIIKSDINNAAKQKKENQ